MTIQFIVEAVLRSRILTQQMEHQIDVLLYQGNFSDADLLALDQLIDQLNERRILCQGGFLKSFRAA